VSNITNNPDDPVHRGLCPGRCGNMFDFLDVIVSPFDGDIWATLTDTSTEQDNCNSNPNATGFDGDSDNDSSDMRGIAIRQVSGPDILPCRISGIGGGCGGRK